MERGLTRAALLGAAAAAAAWAPARAEPPPATNAPPDALRAIERRMAGVRTVRAAFTQEKRLALFREPLRSRGSILFEAPSRFAWRVEEPIRYALVVDERRARQWDGESGRTQETALSANPLLQAVADQLRSWFAGRYSALADTYDARVVSETPAEIEFAPRGAHPAAQALKSVRVAFRGDGSYIERIRIEESGGDVTTLLFADVELNAALPPDAWRVSPAP